MATMDIIKLYGYEPANFLDVGGSASKEKVSAAFKIILSTTPNCEAASWSTSSAASCVAISSPKAWSRPPAKWAITVPLVVRLEGTNVDLGKKILAESGLRIVSADNLADAAKKIVDEVKKAG